MELNHLPKKLHQLCQLLSSQPKTIQRGLHHLVTIQRDSNNHSMLVYQAGERCSFSKKYASTGEAAGLEAV